MSKAELETTENDERTGDFLKVDALDEQAIVAEIEGTTIFEDLFYKTKEGKLVLTWAGIKELRNSMRQQQRSISIPEGHVELVHYHGEEYGKPPVVDFPCTRWCEYVGKAVAKLMQTGERSPAESTQKVLMEVYDRDGKGQKIPDGLGGFKFHYEVDPYGRQKAISKAKRNGIRDFIPELLITKAAEKWEKTKPGKPASAAKSVGSGPATEKKEEQTPPSSPAPNPPQTDPGSIPANSGQGLLSHVQLIEPASLRNFQWYSKTGTKSRQWKEGDDWGWANANYAPGEDWLDIAKPLIQIIKGAGGAARSGEEMISFDGEKGQILRRKLS